MHGHEESPQEEFKFSPRDPSFNSQSESGSIFSEDSDSYNLELHGKIDENSKSFNSRSIGKDLFGSKNLFDSTNNAFGPEGKPDQSRSPDFLKSSGKLKQIIHFIYLFYIIITIPYVYPTIHT